jgi:hypothetical protein
LNCEEGLLLLRDAARERFLHLQYLV